MKLLVALALLALAGCAAPMPGAVPSPATGATAPPIFGPPVALPGEFGADEPSLVVSPDGTALVCAPIGLGHGTEVWRSLDHGRTYERIGQSIPAYGAAYRDGGAGAGGGDCDVAADAAGGLYLADLSGAGLMVARSTDKGATWAATPIPVPPPVDRPWIVGGAAGEVVVMASGGGQTLGYSPLGVAPPPGGGIWVARSSDGGKTFSVPTKAVDNADREGIYGRPVISGGAIRFLYPREPTTDAWEERLATSRDLGATWSTSLVATTAVPPGSCDLGQVFPSLAADAQGRLYAAWSMDEPQGNRTIVDYTVSLDGGLSWKPLAVVDPQAVGDIEAWLAATPSGRVGIAYYDMGGPVHSQRIAGAPLCRGQDAPVAHVTYAEPIDPLDPSKGFRSTAVSMGDTPHRLGDLLNVAFDHEGHALVAYVAGNDTSNVHVSRSLG